MRTGTPSPLLAGFVAIVSFGAGGATGAMIAAALGLTGTAAAALWVVGLVAGFLVGRAVLRRLYEVRV